MPPTHSTCKQHRFFNRGHLLGAVILSLCLTGCSGLTSATLVTAGTVVGIAASAVSTGSDVYRLGRLDAVEMAAMDDVVRSTKRASDDLSLTLTEDPKNVPAGRYWKATVKDDQGQATTLVVERRSKALTRLRIDVGWFGSEATARLFLTRVRTHLFPDTTTRPVAE